MGIFDRLFVKRRKAEQRAMETTRPAPAKVINSDSIETGPPAPATVLQMIGLWTTDADDDEGRFGFPHPASLADNGWETERRDDIAGYLQKGLPLRVFFGFASCRFNDCHYPGHNNLGSKELTDGRWVWPEGLSHYVAHHALRLPDAFVENAALQRFEVPQTLGKGPVVMDTSFWTRWVAEHTAPPLAQAGACSFAEAEAICAELSTARFNATLAPDCGRWKLRCASGSEAFEDFTGPISADSLRGYLFRFRMIEAKSVLSPEQARVVAKEYESEGYEARPFAGMTDKEGQMWWAIIRSGPDKPERPLEKLDLKSIKIPPPGNVLFLESGWQVSASPGMDEPAWRFFLEKWRRELGRP